MEFQQQYTSTGDNDWVGKKQFRLEKVSPRIYTPVLKLKLDQPIKHQVRLAVNRTVVSLAGRGKHYVTNLTEDVINRGIDKITGKKRGQYLNLIENGMPVLEEAPFTSVFGNPVRDYLALSANAPDLRMIGSGNSYMDASKYKKQDFVDYHAIITVDEKKNILMTQVQGRDRSRKEMISGGDLIINVNGKIASRFSDVYPSEEVEKLYSILKSREIVSCNSPFLTLLGISGFVILDYKLPQNTTCKNVQEYSFSAVYEPGIPIILAENKENQSKLDKALKSRSGWMSLTDKIKADADEFIGKTVDKFKDSNIEIQI